MVASASQSSKLLQPSYADCAKNAKAPNQRASLPSNGAMAGTSASTTLTNSSRSALDTGVNKTSSPPATDTKANPGPSTVPVRRQSRSSSPPPPTDAKSTHAVNGDDPANNQLQTNAARRPVPSIKPPPVNVWQMRKEQMAQANAQSRLPLLSNTQNYPYASSDPDSKATGAIVAKEAFSRSSHSANSVLPHACENEDPTTLRSRASPLLPVNDNDSWPEVGSSLRSDSQSGKESRDGSERMERDKSGRGEKYKWVQIPPSELQAAADTLQTRSQQLHLRNQSQHGQYNHTRNQTTSAEGSSSGSVIASRRSSRAQSTHTSTSQSRVHSRTGSVQTSPRHVTRPKSPAENDVPTDNRSGYNSPVPSLNSRPPYSDVPESNSSSGQASGYSASHSVLEQSIRRHNFERAESPSQNNYPGINGNTSSAASQLSTQPHNPLLGSANQTYPYYHGNQHPQRTRSSSSHHLNRNQQMQSTSPQMSNSSDTEGHIPPPPHELEVLDGYRDVASVLSSDQDTGSGNRGRSARNMVFGSIELQGSYQVPRPMTPDPEITTFANEFVEQKAFSAFSIGLPPNELEFSRQRSRARSKARKKGNVASSSAVEVNGGRLEPPRPITDSTESKWEFGTTKHLDTDTSSPPPANGVADVLSHSLSRPSVPETAVELDRRRSEGGDEWEVRDFGYGFGNMSGTGRAPAVVREERLAREKQREQERERERERERELERELERDREREPENYSKDREFGRPRRGSLVGIPDRGGYIPRRGRGNFGPRNFPRGYQGLPRQQAPFTATPPHNIQQLSSHGYSPEPNNAAYYLPQPNYGPYGVGYDVYAYAPYSQVPAVAAPLSSVAFPLDPIRYYLLGQLEYYLSPQNMAQDFFLRQQMDAQGWISILLLASFNRVKQLTMDIELVREVLTLSSLLEVNGDWVRMSGQQWKQFILPNMTTPSEMEQFSGHTDDEVQLDEDEEDEVEFVMG